MKVLKKHKIDGLFGDESLVLGLADASLPGTSEFYAPDELKEKAVLLAVDPHHPVWMDKASIQQFIHKLQLFLKDLG